MKFRWANQGLSEAAGSASSSSPAPAPATSTPARFTSVVCFKLGIGDTGRVKRAGRGRNVGSTELSAGVAKAGGSLQGGLGHHGPVSPRGEAASPVEAPRDARRRRRGIVQPDLGPAPAGPRGYRRSPRAPRTPHSTARSLVPTPAQEEPAVWGIESCLDPMDLNPLSLCVHACALCMQKT